MKTKNILALCAILLGIEIIINCTGNNTAKIITAFLFIATLTACIVLTINLIQEEKNNKIDILNQTKNDNIVKIGEINNSPVEINKNNETPEDEFEKLVFDEIDRINNTKQIMDELQRQRKRQHYIKKPLMTNTEKLFYERLKTIFKGLYTIQPQIALRSIVDNTEKYYASELHRYIDFGLLDNEENVVALIELNDRTHLTQKRHDRDMKVTQICSEAGIPLITFWANNEYTDNEILEKVLKNIPEQDNSFDNFTGEY